MTDREQDIVLCPGQGAQHVGMGKAWFDHCSAAREIFSSADRALGIDLSHLCFEGPEDVLNRTDIAQVAIYTTSVACFRALAQEGGAQPMAATAGLSLGEFTAMHLAGAFDFLTGLRLVHLRGQAMQDAAQSVPGGSGMVALVGADGPQAQQLCREARQRSGHPQTTVLVPANYNCPGQVVISGAKQACELALQVAAESGIKATSLRVAGAFHSPLMAPAAQRLAEALDRVAWNRPQVPVLSNVTAQPHDNQDFGQIKTQLVQQLVQPVCWTQSVQWLHKNVQGRFVELAPGKVLSGLMRRIDRQTQVANMAEPRSLDLVRNKS